MSITIATGNYAGTTTRFLDPKLTAATSPYLVWMLYWQPRKLSRKERRHGRNTRAYQRKTRLWWLVNSYVKLPEER